MKELSLGQEVRIRCVERKGVGCPASCVFNRFGGDCGTVECNASEREDGKDVYFEIVKEKAE